MISPMYPRHPYISSEEGWSYKHGSRFCEAIAITTLQDQAYLERQRSLSLWSTFHAILQRVYGCSVDVGATAIRTLKHQLPSIHGCTWYLLALQLPQDGLSDVSGRDCNNFSSEASCCAQCTYLTLRQVGHKNGPFPTYKHYATYTTVGP